MEKSGEKSNLISYEEEYMNFFPILFYFCGYLMLVQFFFLKAEKDNKRLKMCPQNPLMNCEVFNPVPLR